MYNLYTMANYNFLLRINLQLNNAHTQINVPYRISETKTKAFYPLFKWVKEEEKNRSSKKNKNKNKLYISLDLSLSFQSVYVQNESE